MKESKFAMLCTSAMLSRLNALPMRHFLSVIIGAIIFAGAGLHMAWALPTGFTETVAVTGLQTPTALAFANDGRAFITEQGGYIRLVKKGRLLAAPFAKVKTTSVGERGLLGIALDPKFETNRYVYIYFTVPESQLFNRIARLTVDPNTPDVAQKGSFKIIMDLPKLSATNHNGGAIHFGPDGKLYAGLGENAVRENSQSLTTRLGKILRINSNGTIPTDNPFYSQTSGVNRAIWAMGLRNPYTFAFDPVDGRMFINDVGQSTWEEVNRGKAGANYGWPTCEGTCSTSGMTNPIYAYRNLGGAAITGGTFNRGKNFPSSFAGDYFFSDYLRNFIKRLAPSGQVSSFHTSAKSPVDLAMGPNGKLYYVSIGSGKLYRISYAPRPSPSPAQ